MGDENLHAKRKRMEMELVKGKQIATRLQTLLRDPVPDLEPVWYEELALQILRSFTETLSELNSCSELPESTQIAAGDRGGSSCSMKKPVAKDRRGCYKRRKTSDSWITVSRTIEDGHAWRKYGQKEIINSEYPRCYFKCTHKQQGCKAIKQVQKLKEDPFYYQTTYFNHHTCTDTPGAPHLIGGLDLDSDPMESNLLSFQQVGTRSSSTPKNTISWVEEDTLVMEKESKEDAHDISEAKSSLDPWQDIVVGSDFWFQYNPLWGSTRMSSHQGIGSGQSCGSTSSSGLDIEVDKLDDIYTFQFD